MAKEVTLGTIPRQTPGPMEHRQRPIRIGMGPHRARHIMEPVWVLWDLQTCPLIPHGVALGTTRSSWTHRISVRFVPIHGTKAVLASEAGTAKCGW